MHEFWHLERWALGLGCMLELSVRVIVGTKTWSGRKLGPWAKVLVNFFNEKPALSAANSISKMRFKLPKF